MEIDCKFYMRNWMVTKACMYTCDVDTANIVKPGTFIKGFRGKHEEDKSNKDVRGLDFFGADYIPTGLNIIFPNLTHLAIISSGLKKICHQDLIGFKSLEYLNVRNNQIEVLPDDLFADMKNLELIDFSDNKITSISPRVLEPMKHQLVFADFRDNSESVNFWFERTSIMSTSIEDLMKHLDKERQPKESKSPEFPKKLTKNFERIWTTGNFSDLTIFAGDKQFKVHKTVLAVHSPVFARMFEEQPKFEHGQPKVELSAEATVEALEYLYTGKLPSAAKTTEVLEFAINYEMQELKEICVRSIDETNALDVLEFAKHHEIPRIKDRAFEVIKSMFPEKCMDDPMAVNIELLKKIVEAKRNIEAAQREYDMLCEA